MTPLQATVLGIIQGFSEFLPISSSAHLALNFALQDSVRQALPDRIEKVRVAAALSGWRMRNSVHLRGAAKLSELAS